MTTYLEEERGFEFFKAMGQLYWPLIIVLTSLAMVGVMTLYSVANGSWSPYATAHLIRYSVSLVVLIAVALVPLRIWLATAYPIYIGVFILLLSVPVIGEINMGARRWISIGGFQLQPSEMMKVALVLALARYYHGLEFRRVSTIQGLILPLAMIGLPMGLVFIQPDLGTALLIGFTGVAMILLAGLSWRFVILGLLFGLFAVAGAIQSGLVEEYQIRRVTAFLDPSLDPLGANFHPTQSKIAIGSGGLDGKGYMGGTQSQLGFLPEKHTDFIFTIFGEEFGFTGTIILIGLYVTSILMCTRMATSVRSHFGRMICMGIGFTFATYVLVNTGMVMGLAPVVGVPLPLVSYGGTVMLAMMGGFGLVMCAWVNRNQDTLRTQGWRTRQED